MANVYYDNTSGEKKKYFLKKDNKPKSSQAFSLPFALNKKLIIYVLRERRREKKPNTKIKPQTLHLEVFHILYCTFYYLETTSFSADTHSEFE